ncbi:MAG: tRNA (adenosine(37)-N6)-threonylcarbamoyltransferase complex dimerization subunit type 1 TsaB [Bacteroidota bacterium]
MALILNLETATTVCSVSIARDGVLLALKEQNGDYSHAENLTLFIEDALQQSHISFSDLDAVAVSKGPGSYTGLRIGVSTAKGLCYALNKPLIAVNTLEQLTLGVLESFKAGDIKSGKATPDVPSFFCPMLDARRMEVYCALYDSELRNIYPVSAEIVDEYFFDKIIDQENKANCRVYFFGDGASKCKKIVSVNVNAFFISDVIPSAKNMISLSEKAFTNKQFEDIAYFEPFYLKDFVAGKKKIK